MKKLTLVTPLSILFGFIFTISGCKKKDVHSSAPDVLNDIAVLLTKGFDTTGIMDMGDHYLVEKDIIIYKTSLSGVTPRQAFKSNTELVNSSKQRNITVRIDNSVYQYGANFNWSAEVSEAINEYNNLATSNIRFTLVNSVTADITIKVDLYTQGANPSSVIAAAPPPSNGNPGSYIIINRGYTGNAPISSGQKKYNLVHELGHCLGIMHTNWYNTGEGPFPGIGNSPNSSNNMDFNSVMNGGTALNTWDLFPFSTWDIYAVSFLYPSTTLTVSGPDQICTSGEYTVAGLPSNAEVTWSTSNGFPISCTSCNTTSLTINSSESSEWLSATISYNGQPVVTTSPKWVKNKNFTYVQLSISPSVLTTGVQPYTTYSISYSASDLTNAQWQLPPDWTLITQGSGYMVFKTGVSTGAHYTVSVAGTNGCNNPANGYLGLFFDL